MRVAVMLAGVLGVAAAPSCRSGDAPVRARIHEPKPAAPAPAPAPLARDYISN